ncbi:MAG: hypothetical protein NXI00_01580 [Cytophagales bacterium]|nr:hypothetical protein [Cytophagales bacterium]
MKRTNIKSYHNSTDLEYRQYNEALIQTETQDQIILHFFKKYPTLKLSRYQLLDMLIESRLIQFNTQSSSIGRSLNTLMRKGYVSKLNDSIVERYGRKNYLWCLSKLNPEFHYDNGHLKND